MVEDATHIKFNCGCINPLNCGLIVGMNIKDLTKGLLTVRQVAELCEVTVQAVYKWEKSERIPAEYCRAIEQATNGKVTRYELRPDVFGVGPECECTENKEAA